MEIETETLRIVFNDMIPKKVIDNLESFNEEYEKDLEKKIKKVEKMPGFLMAGKKDMIIAQLKAWSLSPVKSFEVRNNTSLYIYIEKAFLDSYVLKMVRKDREAIRKEFFKQFKEYGAVHAEWVN